MQNLWTVTNYHTAYYGAISAVERAELGLRYRSPWFEWSGWFLWSTGYGPVSDYTPALITGDQQWFWRTIQSRTYAIPNTGMGNTDPMLSYPDGDSKDYNQLWYTYLETFLLSYDATSNPQLYYTWGNNLSFFSGNTITGTLRLPPKILSGFGWSTPGSLCNVFLDDCDPDGDGIYDDIAVSWSLEWLYHGNGFKIFPTIAVFYYSGMQVDERMDNSIRESIINATWTITMDTSLAHRFSFVQNGYALKKHTVVGVDATAIEQTSFSNIFSDISNNFSWLRLSFGAANIFRAVTGAIYPYLEYQFSFPQAIADRYYTIQWHGRVGEYDVQIILKKPTIQGTVGWDFTVIF